MLALVALLCIKLATSAPILNTPPPRSPAPPPINYAAPLLAQLARGGTYVGAITTNLGFFQAPYVESACLNVSLVPFSSPAALSFSFSKGTYTLNAAILQTSRNYNLVSTSTSMRYPLAPASWAGGSFIVTSSTTIGSSSACLILTPSPSPNRTTISDGTVFGTSSSFTVTLTNNTVTFSTFVNNGLLTLGSSCLAPGSRSQCSNRGFTFIFSGTRSNPSSSPPQDSPPFGIINYDSPPPVPTPSPPKSAKRPPLPPLPPPPPPSVPVTGLLATIQGTWSGTCTGYFGYMSGGYAICLNTATTPPPLTLSFQVSINGTRMQWKNGFPSVYISSDNLTLTSNLHVGTPGGLTTIRSFVRLGASGNVACAGLSLASPPPASDLPGVTAIFGNSGQWALFYKGPTLRANSTLTFATVVNAGRQVSSCAATGGGIATRPVCDSNGYSVTCTGQRR